MTPRRIIIAEDDAATRTLLERRLRSAGYQVIACEDGREALSAIQSEGSGILLADWNMPNMTGPELCRTIRQLSEQGELGFVFFVLLTAHSDQQEILAGFEAGADDYLTKPYNTEELLARLRAGERIYRLQDDLAKANRQLATLKDEFQRLALTDPLTHLANRRCLFERLRREWAYAERTDQPLGCLIFDIDHFKNVNDNYGHNAGDAVLKSVSATAQRVVRVHDMLGRLGGEEFLILVRDGTPEGLRHLGDRLRKAIADEVTRFEGREIRVTVSVGCAIRRDSHTDPDALIGDADQALYRAKETGRNRTQLHAALQTT